MSFTVLFLKTGYLRVSKSQFLGNVKGYFEGCLFIICILNYIFLHHLVADALGGLRSVQAEITSFSLYAVVSRLKSYKFFVSAESPEFTCSVPGYPDVNVTVPSVQDFTFTMKVRELSLGTIEHILWIYSF